MKHTLIAISLLSLMSCSQTNGDKTNSQNEETNISLSKTEALVNLTEEAEPVNESKLLFKAHGMEPGWFAEIYNNKLRLLVDYGKDSVLLNENFDGVASENGFTFAKNFSLNDKPAALAISIENKPCNDAASGDKEDRTVKIKFNNKEYKGCGSFLK